MTKGKKVELEEWLAARADELQRHSDESTQSQMEMCRVLWEVKERLNGGKGKTGRIGLKRNERTRFHVWVSSLPPGLSLSFQYASELARTYERWRGVTVPPGVAFSTLVEAAKSRPSYGLVEAVAAGDAKTQADVCILRAQARGASRDSAESSRRAGKEKEYATVRRAVEAAEREARDQAVAYAEEVGDLESQVERLKAALTTVKAQLELADDREKALREENKRLRKEAADLRRQLIGFCSGVAA